MVREVRNFFLGWQTKGEKDLNTKKITPSRLERRQVNNEVKREMRWQVMHW